VKKKIFIVTGTRAEYGLLYKLIKKLYFDRTLNSKIIATGMHLSKRYGNTYKEIINDGFKIYKKIDILDSSNTNLSISQSVGKGILSFSKFYQKEKPDLIVVLGDRFELMSIVIPANIQQIPVLHIGGGDLTYGSQDENIRHSITKMSWLHAVSNLESKRRVIQLGENPKNVFYCGSLGTERIENFIKKSKQSIEKLLNFKFDQKNILITFHSVTHEKKSPKRDFSQILKAIKLLKNTKLIFTYPNSDANSKVIIDMINNFVSKNKNAVMFKSLGSNNYYSLMSYVDCVLGNSSSGVLEAPSFKIATINIGDRQKGRMQAKSIINCKPNKDLIIKSINHVYNENFKKIVKKVKNPYKANNCSNKIYKIIKKFKKPVNLKKDFYNL
tara:strand:+ start:7652 stop:8806 length:1155 start_codon:yes stop_codon:yes gene_type:complete